MWLLGLCFLLIGCKDTVYRSSVPTYPVDFRINIAGEYVHFVIDNPGQVITVEKQRFPVDAIGFAGLVVCTGWNIEYCAYDMACPSCLSQTDNLEVNESLMAVCPLCTEEYEIMNGIGNPTKGIVRENLRKYHTMLQNGYLHIYQ